MAQRALREVDGKRLLASRLPLHVPADAHADTHTRTHAHAAERIGVRVSDMSRALQVSLPESGASIDFDALAASAPWVRTTRLVAKPDQLVKRRGKGGLLLLDADWPGVVQWVTERMGTTVDVEGVTGTLNTFLVEPFLPHPQSDEYYVCISSRREGEDIFFTTEVCAPTVCAQAMAVTRCGARVACATCRAALMWAMWTRRPRSCSCRRAARRPWRR